MRIVNYSEVARKMVREALRIRPGEVVSLGGGRHAAGLLDEIWLEVRCAGGFPMMEPLSDNLYRRMVTEVPLEYLEKPNAAAMNKMELIDCHVSVGGAEDPTLLSDIDASRKKALEIASFPVARIMEERKRARRLRTLGMGFPVPREAALSGMPFEEYHDLFWNAVLIDLKAMREKQKKLASVLRDAEKISIESAKGTRITFSLRGRTILLDAGFFDDEDFTTGNLTTNWPCGEVWVAPVEESAEGVAVFDEVFHQGKRIVDLSLTFNRGRIVHYSARENADVFGSMLGEAEGDRDVIAELGIGTNPEVTRITGHTLLDEKIIGTIHLAIGSNRYFGGNNSSTLHKDMVMLRPSLSADGSPLIVDGKF
jgi:aminopeptidase